MKGVPIHLPISSSLVGVFVSELQRHSQKPKAKLNLHIFMGYQIHPIQTYIARDQTVQMKC